jgi:hypothetical protein
MTSHEQRSVDNSGNSRALVVVVDALASGASVDDSVSRGGG